MLPPAQYAILSYCVHRCYFFNSAVEKAAYHTITAQSHAAIVKTPLTLLHTADKMCSN